MDKNQQPPQQIPIELDEKAAEGIYSNFVLTAHTASEFILDFARLVPGINKAKVFARIIMTPQSAKSLNTVLAGAIKQFEASYGAIQIAQQKGTRPDGSSIGFQNLPGQDQEKKSSRG